MKRVLCVLLAAVLLFSAGCGRRDEPPAPFSERIINASEVVTGIRHGLKNHAKTITVSFDYGSVIFADLNEAVGAWVEAALDETDDPAEGDYIRYQYGGYTYTSRYTENDSVFTYTVVITPDYYCRLSQEEEAGVSAKALLKSFRFMPWTSDQTKIRTIYSWLCQNVSYDKVHRKNPYYHLCSTAYAALVQHSATCQGYCTALYRLLREAGIRCRVVTGNAVGPDGQSEQLHAWVIAELGGLWYGLDPTWDAGADEYRCFLAGMEEMADHIPGAAFMTEEFLNTCPMAEHSYDLSE